MKHLIFLLLPILANAQGYRPRSAPLALSFVSGAAWGLHEKTAHHWPQFQARFPDANPRFWNPAVSWRNKYKNGEPEQGRNGVPIWATDAKHILATTNQTFIGQKRKWWHYAADAGLSFMAYSLGNKLTFNWIY
jgi:hypothetical protein